MSRFVKYSASYINRVCVLYFGLKYSEPIFSFRFSIRMHADGKIDKKSWNTAGETGQKMVIKRNGLKAKNWENPSRKTLPNTKPSLKMYLFLNKLYLQFDAHFGFILVYRVCFGAASGICHRNIRIKCRISSAPAFRIETLDRAR